MLTFASAPGHGEIVRATLENPRSGEVLAEMTFTDPWVGYGGFEFVDASGNTLAAIDSRTVNSAAADLDRDDLQDGPSWRMDTSAEPWTAVPIGSE